MSQRERFATKVRQDADAIWIEDAEFLISASNLTYAELATRMGCCVNTVYRTLKRTGRTDLIARLRANRTTLNGSRH